jgi:hypothetical protein
MTIAIRVAVGFALLAYPVVLYFNLTVHPPMDPAGEVFTAIFTAVLWLSLSLALLLAGIQSGIPLWSGVVAVLVIPFFCASAIPVAELLVRRQSLRWMTVVPAAAGPLVILAYVAWASIPGIRGVLSANLASGIVWGALFALALMIPWKERLDSEQAERERVPRLERADQLKQIPPDAPVRDWLPFLSDSETRDAALQKIRALTHKESDIEQMMQHGDYTAFGWLDQFELSPTPALCECVRTWLRTQTVSLKRTPTQSSYRDIMFTSGELGTLQWFAGRRCPMLDELSAFEAALVAYPDPSESDKILLERLDSIKRRLRTP